MTHTDTFSIDTSTMNAESPDISVVICAYSNERWQDLLQAIESVRQQSMPRMEIIVVVDNNPGLLEQLRNQVSDIKALENRGTRGLSGARNTGIAAAQGAIIAFIDDDAVAEPGWLEKIKAAYRPEVLGVGGPIEPMWLQGRPRWFPAEFDWVVGCTFRGLPVETAAVSKLIGCNMSFRREVFDALGGFRTDMGRVGTHPLAGEETEFSLRVCQRWPEKSLIYEPSARVKHRVPAKRANVRYFRARCYGEGLSKALVARLVGVNDGLAHEWDYTSRTLPLGVLRGLSETILHRDPAGLGRALAIVAGLAITTVGYIQGVIALRASAPIPATGAPAPASEESLT